MREHNSGSPARWVSALVVVVAGLCGVMAVLAVARPWTDHKPRSTAVASLTVPSPPSPQPSPPAPSTPEGPQAFPTTSCQPAVVAAGSGLGIGVPRPARLTAGGPEALAFEAAYQCLTKVGGAPAMLRTQLPIDALRRAEPSDDERAELTAFAALLKARGASGVVSIRAHDFTSCGPRHTVAARQVDRLRADQPLKACEFPTPQLYGQLFKEIVAALRAAHPTADVRFTAWNEPDHTSFTLSALGEEGAARRAGRYWAQAAAVVGPDRVLAGEFADRDLPTLLRLRAAFIDGAGSTPTAWALHPYRDLTAAPVKASGAAAATPLAATTPTATSASAATTPAATTLPPTSVTGRFAAAVAPAPVWLTEATPLLSGRRGIGGDAAGQLARGQELRAQLAAGPTRVMLYLLTPPPPPTTRAADGWDSAIADRQGRARPFICGLAGLAATDCPGDPATFGG